MENNIQSFKLRWYILVLFLASLATSVVLNVYLYSEAIKPSYKGVIGTWIDRSIQGGMGDLRVGVINPHLED